MIWIQLISMVIIICPISWIIWIVLIGVIIKLLLSMCVARYFAHCRFTSFHKNLHIALTVYGEILQ